MWTVVVDLEVRPERLEEFIEEVRANAAASVRDEPGCLRFDVHRSVDDPLRFMLHEVYVDREAFEVAHRAAAHYARWNDAARRCLVDGGRHNTYFEPVTLTGGEG